MTSIASEEALLRRYVPGHIVPVRPQTTYPGSALHWRPIRTSRAASSSTHSRSTRLSDNPIYAPSPSSRSPLHPSNPFHIPPPTPADFPPISERLRPLLPFFLYWTALTSLAYHLLRVRKEGEEEMGRRDAQVSVLEGLIGRLRRGEGRLSDEEMNRELEMVNLRPRFGSASSSDATDLPTSSTDSQLSSRPALDAGLSEGRSIGWREVFLGRKRSKLTEAEAEKRAEDEWRGVLLEAAKSATSTAPPTNSPSNPTSEPYETDSSAITGDQSDKGDTRAGRGQDAPRRASGSEAYL